MIHAEKQLDGWIEVSDDDGSTWSAVTEYSTKITEDYAKTYIEAKTGQCFRFRLAGLCPPTSRTVFRVLYFCDGNEAADRIFGAYEDTWPLEGLDASKNAVVPFKFDALQTTDQKQNACELDVTETLGVLRMDVWRIVLGEECRAYPSDFEKKVPERETFLEQQVKKTSNHRVVYGGTKAVSQLASVAARKLDDTPYVSFHFRYLSDALLALKGIRPFEEEEDKDEANENPPVAGPSNPTRQYFSQDPNSKDTSKGKGKRRRDSSASGDAEQNNALRAQIKKLQLENARLRKKVKVEEEEKVDLTED